MKPEPNHCIHSCLKKQKKKSEEHFSLMEPECCKKGNETEKKQGLRFADE